MPIDLPKQYDPASAQAKWYTFWEQKGYFHSEPDPSRPHYSMVIPPPNVTGALHLGHALNNTLQDILIRWRRMQGYNTLWMPGTDHAGIATQAVVERRLFEEEKKTRHDIGREELVRRIWAWKDDYERRILHQLKQLGASCDWPRTRFTLDPVCARAVRRTFFLLFKEGLIFRGKRLVNWDTHLQTAVADDEVYHETVHGHLWTFRYPVKGTSEFVRIATTRPETMLGDTAVAVHPDDPRYRHLIGKSVMLPLVDREIPIIADGILVDPAFGTGCVKVTPAHDPNDYDTGLRHKLPMINILNPDGTINENGGRYRGLDRYAARKKVVEDLQVRDLVEKIEPYETDIGHSDRSKTPIEPYLSDQWFVRMADLAESAMQAVRDGRVKFHPERYAKTYLDWLSEKRDWCISRQLWWGHRIPVWTCTTAEGGIVNEGWLEQQKQNQAAARAELKAYFQAASVAGDEYAIQLPSDYEVRVCAESDRAYRALVALEQFMKSFMPVKIQPGQPPPSVMQSVPDFPHATSAALNARRLLPITQDPDVLDTWFSSALWTHSTFGWPEPTPELKYYYPTSVLSTAREIITLWVARMVMLGLHNMGDVPFRDVYIHPVIQDGEGRPMKKSLGNGVDPLDIIDRYGCDALRFTIAYMTSETQDVRMPVKSEKLPDGRTVNVSERFELGRNFSNKLWNASRLVLMNLEGYEPRALDLAASVSEQSPDPLAFEDRWILSRLADTAARATGNLENFRFHEAAKTLYDFAWGEFCDWYLEMIKPRLRDAQSRRTAQGVVAHVLDCLLRLLHPFVPFLTEEVWSHLGKLAPHRGLPTPQAAAESVMIAPWPDPSTLSVQRSTTIETEMARLQQLITGIRNLRSRFGVEPRARIEILARCSADLAAALSSRAHYLTHLDQTFVGSFTAGPDVTRPAQSGAEVLPEFEIYLPLADLIDVEAELARLKKKAADLDAQITRRQAKLASESFLSRAPADVVQRERELLAELQSQRSASTTILTDLGSQT